MRQIKKQSERVRNELGKEKERIKIQMVFVEAFSETYAINRGDRCCYTYRLKGFADTTLMSGWHKTLCG